jgi:hypothetical protein
MYEGIVPVLSTCLERSDLQIITVESMEKIGEVLSWRHYRRVYRAWVWAEPWARGCDIGTIGRKHRTVNGRKSSYVKQFRSDIGKPRRSTGQRQRITLPGRGRRASASLPLVSRTQRGFLARQSPVLRCPRYDPGVQPDIPQV